MYAALQETTQLWLSSLPFVILAICDDLRPLANGTIMYHPETSPRLQGSTATYSCNFGYTLYGDTTVRTCIDIGSGGVWNGSDLICQGWIKQICLCALQVMICNIVSSITH